MGSIVLLKWPTFLIIRLLKGPTIFCGGGNPDELFENDAMGCWELNLNLNLHVLLIKSRKRRERG